MGRLDDIIARNTNPKASFRRSRGQQREAPTTSDPPVSVSDAEPAVSRLDQIIARNQRPNGNYRWLKVGLAGVVLFVVLILLIFTDLAAPPEAAYPSAPAAPAAKPTGVGGVKLWRAPTKPGSAGDARR